VSLRDLAMMSRLSFLFLTVAVAGCSGSGVQRASIGAPMVDRGPPSEMRRSVVRPESSSIEVTSGTLFASFESKITRFSGWIEIDPADSTRGRIVIDLDMTSFANPSPVITDILQHDFLEVDSYPHARLDATFRPADGAAEERVVDGLLDLHGVQRAVSFNGRLTREGGDYRFTTAFDIDRHPFGIRQHSDWDWVNRSDFRVRIDLRAE
jgi:polyisoprenoid-binding protein YceI